MTTLEYVNYRKNQPCPKKQRTPKVDHALHALLGQILSKETSERKKMEISKPKRSFLPPEELDFMF